MKTKTLLFFLVLCFSSLAVGETFKCKTDGRTIYSERPCGSDAAIVAGRVTFSHDPAPHPVFLEPLPDVRVVQVKPVQQVQQVQKNDCKDKQADLDNVRSRLRAGYTAQQSVALYEWERLAGISLDLCRKNLRER